MKNCGCDSKVGCGCGDNVLTTSKCSQPTCLTPEECAEQFSSNCVMFMGDTIANLDIRKGDSLTTVIQKLAQAIVNPTCAYPTSSCGGAVGFGSTNITSTTISLKWNEVEQATAYEVEYRLLSSPTWLVLASTTGTSQVIAGLSANSVYVVRVKSTCASGSCYSLVLEITTKP